MKFVGTGECSVGFSLRLITLVRQCAFGGAYVQTSLNGEEVPKTVVLDTLTVTKENAGEILKANGLM